MAFANGGRVVTDGLVLSLDARDRNSYVSGSTIWNDLSGNGNNGTFVGNLTYNSASNGNILFDGTSSYIDTGKTAAQLGVYDADYTFDAWVYPTDFNPASNNDRTMFGTTQQSTRMGLHLVFRSGIIYQGHYASDYGVSTGNINAWNYICYTYKQSTGLASIYKNGVLQGAGTIASFIGTTNILIGKSLGGGPFVGNGSIYKIYNRTLTASEVLQNYNASKSRFNLK
jgi:Concanavalin A-like lectin/glucanases superfamily